MILISASSFLASSSLPPFLNSSIDSLRCLTSISIFFFFKDPATPEIYPLPLHDALPIWRRPAHVPNRLGQDLRPPQKEPRLVRPHPVLRRQRRVQHRALYRLPRLGPRPRSALHRAQRPDRKSTRLNSSHLVISYAVFCLK